MAVAKRTRAGAASAALRSGGVATTFAKIAPARAAQLFRWNRILTVLHAVQAIVIVAISPTEAAIRFEGTYPVSNIVDGQFAGLTAAKELLFSFPLAYLVAAFFALSALAHFLVAYPLRERYEGWLAQQFNPMRWAEYALSSTLMIVGVASLSFITDAGALVAIAVCNASMNLFGWSMRRRTLDEKTFSGATTSSAALRESHRGLRSSSPSDSRWQTGQRALDQTVAALKSSSRYSLRFM